MVKRYSLIIACFLIAVIVSVTAILKSQKPVVGTSFLMNTVVEYKLYGKQAESAKKAIDGMLQKFENKVSCYIDDSEVGQLNRNAGKKPVSISNDTMELLSRCTHYGEISNGSFDVSIAPLTETWNVTSDSPEIPSTELISELLSFVNYKDILLDEENRTAFLKKQGQAVDVGGIAKGFVCDLVRKVAQDYGVKSGYISIGGNLMVIGSKPDGSPFKFGVRNPRGSVNDYIGIVTLPNSTMATSGDYERYFEENGVRYHHILDPKTGWPAKTDLMSVSVVTPDGAYADFMSTYLFIKGKEFALEQLETLNCGLIIIDKDKNVYISKNLQNRFEPSDSTGLFQFHGVSS